jgi:hypothetical protein
MASSGPLYPATTANLSEATTLENKDAWANPGNVVSDNGTETSITAATFDSPDISQILVVSNFGFAIPTNAVINGVTVEVDRRSIIANSGKDFRVQLANGTTFASLIGTNKAVPATIWPTTSTVATYGGATDVWGASLTPAIVNSSSFAVFFSAQANIANSDIGVDYIRVTVNYTEPTTQNGSFTADAHVSRNAIANSLTANAYIKNTMYGTGSGSAVLIHDNFTTGSVLNGRTPDTVNNGNTWVNGGIAFQVGSGLVTMLSGNTEVGYIQASTANVDVELSGISMSNVTTFGAVFRYQDINNFWHIDAYQGSTVDEDNWYLYKRVSGVDQSVASGPGGQAPQTVRAVANGSDISVYIDGATTPDWTGTDSTFSTSTVVGIYADTSSSVGGVTASAFKATSVGGLNTTFTADAHIKREFSGSFTADAEIAQSATVVEGSFTADAHIAATVSGAFTADAHVKREFQQSFTADAHVLRTWGGQTTDYDSFTDTNGTALSAHTGDTGRGWSEIFGNPTINSGTVTATTAGSNARMTGAGALDGFASMRFYTGSDGVSRGNSIRFRYSSNSDFLFAKVRRSSTPVNQIQLWRRIGGVTDGAALATTTLAAGDLAANTWYTLSVRYQGPDIRIYLDGVEKLATTSTFQLDNPSATGLCLTFEESMATGQSVDDFRFASPQSFTADAWISATISGSVTANAHILRTFESNFTANSIIRKTDIAGSVTADAYVRRVDITQSITADAYVKREFSGSVTADAMVQRTFEGSFTVDAWVQEASATTYTGSFTADAWVKGTPTGSFTANAHIAASPSGTFTADAFVQKTTSGSFTANAWLSIVSSGSLTADAWVKGVVLGSLTADAWLSKTQTGSFTVDANITRGATGSFTADAWVKGTPVGTFTANAFVRKTDIAGSITANAYVRRTDLTGSLTANAWVKRTFEGSVTANAHIASTVSGSFTADAWIASLGTVVGSFTADAIIRRTDLAGSFTANAYISRQALSSFSVDAYIKRTFGSSFTADSWVKGTLAGQISADAFIQRTSAQFITADAFVQSTLYGSVTADAWLQGTRMGAFTVNAIISNPNAVKAVESEVAILRTYDVKLEVHATLDSVTSVGRSLVGRTEKFS